MFHPHGSRVCQTRPCDRNDGVNAENWNQRAYNSPVNSLVGVKPPVSDPQNGVRLSEALRPTGTCAASVSHRQNVSPDQTQPP